MKLVKAAFDGPYPLEFGKPLYPAIDETIEMCPFFLYLKKFSTSLTQ